MKIQPKADCHLYDAVLKKLELLKCYQEFHGVAAMRPNSVGH
jgi:hypothetical protein